MRKSDLNIGVLESSYLISEGIANILSKFENRINVYFVEDFNSLKLLNIKTKTDIVFVNPLFLVNKSKEFSLLKEELSETVWVGLVNNFIDKQVLSLLDFLIYSNDSSEKILNVMSLILEEKKDKCGSKNQKETLSEREKEVLRLLVSGDSNKEIADKLNVSTNTIITHRKNITQKTGIKSLSGLTIFAVVNGVVSIDDYASFR